MNEDLDWERTTAFETEMCSTSTCDVIATDGEFHNDLHARAHQLVRGRANPFMYSRSS